MIDVSRFIGLIAYAANNNPGVNCPRYLVLRQREGRSAYTLEAFMAERETMRLMVYSASENSEDTLVVATIHWYEDGPRAGEAWSWKRGIETRLPLNEIDL